METRLGETNIQLCEKELMIEECHMREVRRLCPGGHQTSIVTTNYILHLSSITACMFGRWVQENFFRYMRQDYALDRIIQYAVDEIDSNIVVVNREYSNIQYKIKKEREKLSRLKARHYNVVDKDKAGQWMIKEMECIALIKEKDIEELIQQRQAISYKIPLAQMPEGTRYSKLKEESKLFTNMVKIICYRAETAFANLMIPYYRRAEDEIRMLAKAAINQTVD